MGGGGGNYFNDNPQSLIQDLHESQSRTQNTEYEVQSNRLLDSYLSEFNDRDNELIARHLEQVKNALGKELEGTIDLRYGGSVAKHTYVNGLSDVDSLVMLDNCDLAERSPGEAKDYLASRLRERFPQTEISEGPLAVTVHFTDIDIQLLPAVSCRNQVSIPDATGARWAEIKPTEFTNALTRVNQAEGGKVVPTVKLAKAIIANLPENQRISGYHSESLAVELFNNYTGERRTKDMLKYYFSNAAARIIDPLRDSTGQSVHVDDTLGPAGSLERRIIADSFARVARRMSNADAAGQLEDWRKLFEQ